MFSHVSTMTDGRVHVPVEYQGRLTEDPAYDWDHAPLEPALIPVPDLRVESDPVAAESLAEPGLAVNGLAQAVPVAAELRVAA